MNSSEIRQTFLDFFESKQHKIESSAAMVIKDDPTLMFTNAGMNQFKDLFLGNSPIKYKRIANSQKCLRVSGKHNDLEEVGHDTYHHTMFEMLGNWSFGDYFKQEAIDWAWELLVDVLKLPTDRLYASVFEGSEEDKMERDDEAAGYWEKYLPANHIINGNKKDNFWEMGDVGPCGPCSEIHIDLRSEDERKLVDGRDLINMDHPQVVEIWNLVFMQFNRKADGSLESLPHQHVDTGMGFERLCMAMQKKQSNYDTDVFQPIIQAIAKMCGKTYGKNEEVDIALRVIADHIRTISFAITDGQLPSNNKAGYVIRRILRRAVRYGYTFLDLKDPFMYRLVEVLIEVMGKHFPELIKQRDLIEKVVKEEENSFLRTLANGIKLLDQIIEKTKEDDFKVVQGKVAFELYDTYGFPLDLTELILKENDLVVNRREFNEAMEAQKNRSRSATAMETGDWIEILKDDNEEFVGYDYLSTDVKITRYRKMNIKGKDLYQLVFNYTPFYGESGGQVGDTGYIEANGEKVSIVDTKKETGLIIHITDELPSDPTLTFKAVVNTEKRQLIANNHTATHLLHAALREVLGDHVEQKGSLVTPDHLRFDFSHFQKLTEEEIAKVEEIVNTKIRENATTEIKNNIPMQEAVELGAMALFGEKYGDLVRVVKLNESVELCGGTHVKATGQIGLFKFTSEGAISAGVRRIEAITAVKAEKYINDKLNTLKEIERTFKSNQNLLKNIEALISENSEMKKGLEAFQKDQLKLVKNALKSDISETKGVNFISKKMNIGSADAIKDVAYQLKAEVENLVFIAGADLNGKANLTIMFSDNLVKEYGLNAGAIVREAAKEIKGGGGGQAFFASAGGKDPQGIDAAISTAKKMILHKIEG
ncbi:alanine--tRNA ligase [Ancylomarina euxinus]|uniref:Alanine--tRNA ligase n=1 Tax=Ancylomarina euxinus TaxID=2283627 RepID=A0A425Y557_9BACT|nr:alanine--tRNA ligase [Ancylomarina euxinus]MCZ4694369.1 alanine--tRNA ligase [Ancylomarina euxinus]MUP14300.1 alanine--tRNA ligase [Ancylomarina euxinus]RRG23617.1 alanine--tRNA ligase [Ancylomarina euxinus]